MVRVVDDSWKIELLESILTPLVKIMLRTRLTYSAFAHACRNVYAREAAKRLERKFPGRQPTLTELTVESGVPLSDLRVALDEEEASERTTPRVFASAEAAVLHTWRCDKRFSGEGDSISTLPLTSDSSEATFRELVRKATKSNVGYRDMLARLVEAGNVAVSENKREVALTNPSFSSHSLAKMADRLPQIAQAAATFLVCLERNSTGDENCLFERRVYTRYPRPDTASAIAAHLRSQYAETLECGHEFEDTSQDETGHVVGVGYYVFEMPNDGFFFEPTVERGD